MSCFVITYPPHQSLSFIFGFFFLQSLSSKKTKQKKMTHATKQWMCGIEFNAAVMFLTCFFSVGLMVPVQIQLARISAWTLTTWLALSITQVTLAWMAVSLAVMSWYRNRHANSQSGDPKSNYLAFIAFYAILATHVVIRFGTLYRQATGEYRANVLEATTTQTGTVSHLELDLREALTYQNYASAVALASITSFVFGIISSVAFATTRQLSNLTDISLGSVLGHNNKKSTKKTTTTSKTKQKPTHKIEDSSSSDSESD